MRLIRAETVEKMIEHQFCTPCKKAGADHNGVRCAACAVDDVISILDMVPTADPERHAHWIVTHENDGTGLMRPFTHCSACKFRGRYMSDFKYCPKCGTKMDEVKQSATD